MVEGLIVAAGKSERTGNHYKMALKIGQRSVIEKAVSSMLPYCSKVTVVTGFNASFIADVTKPYKQVELVHNPDFEAGMFSSVKIGLRRIVGSHCLFLPGDYPLISASVYETLLSHDSEILIPTYNQQPGHPILLRRPVIENILVQNCHSLREFIGTQKPALIEVDCPGILMDIDTMDDYAIALNYYTGVTRGRASQK